MSQISHRTLSDSPQSTVSVVIVGQTDLALFQRLLTFLRGDSAIRVRAECITISEAIDFLPEANVARNRSGVSAVAASLPEVDVVVVLQSHSDEYGTRDVQRLIGQMLFGRVVCCYGPWCLADGRTHSIWPVSCRVPVESAPVWLAAEFRNVREQRTPLSPMSAAEEVFVHRTLQPLSVADWKQPDFCVVSDDRVLRNTVARLCQELREDLQPGVSAANAVRMSSLRMAPSVLAPSVLRNRSESLRSLIVLVDLDPLDESCHEFLRWLEEWLRNDRVTGLVIGITVFAESSFSLPMLHGIFDKLELAARLRELPALAHG